MVKKIVSELVLALNYFHKANKPHGNFYPRNILISSNLKVKVKSFVNIPSTLIQTNLINNNDYFYYSPNLLYGTQEKNIKDDIWALGCIIIEMLTGNKPWENLNFNEFICKMNENDSFVLPKFISVDCKLFLSECLNKNENLRVNAKELLNHPFISDLIS